MKKKALLLAAIAKDAASLMNSLPEQDRGRVQKTLKAFSHNAQTALNLNSVFYMSALLYPDDHQKGEPNTLQKLIASL
ncbi:MAG: hypothetical protein LBD42_02500 [Desulfovibrio sp.]|nr:hypothetical protein [Desulfovibrio sp.]